MVSTYRPGHIPGKTKATLYVDPLVHRALRMRAAATGLSMGEIAERALRKELGMMELTWQVIEVESDGDYHSVKLVITPDSVEVSGGIDQDKAFDAAVEETGGDRNSIEANTCYSNHVADALTDIVSAVVAAGITGGDPQYEEHDSYCEARIRLADGRTLVLCAHYYDGNFDAQIGEE